MKLYVGNLARTVTEDRVKELFDQYGEVRFFRLLKDRFTGELRGFGFVEYDSKEAAQEAIAAMDGYMLDGRAMRVSEAQERKPREGGSREGGPREGGYRGGNGGGSRRPGGFGGSNGGGHRGGAPRYRNDQ